MIIVQNIFIHERVVQTIFLSVTSQLKCISRLKCICTVFYSVLIKLYFTLEIKETDNADKS